jgi:hypothetical protein
MPIADGFLIPLPEGTGVDWYRPVRTVRAADGCTLERQGATVAVSEPQVIALSTALPLLPGTLQWLYPRLGIRQFRCQRRSPTVAGREAEPVMPRSH